MTRGVIFLADDGVLELAVAFLNSVRAHNPSLPICLIPFSDSIARLKGLADTYGFVVYDDHTMLSACDRISERFHGRRLGHYRKIAAWHGPFEQFIYIDVDTVVVDSLDFVFELLGDFDFVVSHSHMASTAKWVWKSSIRSRTPLTGEQIAFAASTGFVASRRLALTVEAAMSKVPSALDLSRHMALSCKEQPFLNYLIVTSGRRYTSLSLLVQTWSHARVPHSLRVEYWAGQRTARAHGGRIQPGGRRPPILLVHWAGCWAPTRLERAAFAALRILGLRDEAHRPQVRRAMPHSSLWRHYRSLGVR